MPRCARLKSIDSIYHIMVRSISDTPLYKCGSDKDMYLGLIKKYKDIYMFKVYSYCIMDTHAHIIIDSLGADISKIMHSVNQCYAQYFNNKYKRHGHLFQDRFKSKIVHGDRHLLGLSSYIHNNPSDIKEYKDREESYIYSSFGIYLGIYKDMFRIVDTDLILEQFSKDPMVSRMRYLEFVREHKEEPGEDTEFIHEKAEYRSERKIIIRDIKACDVVDFVASYTKKNRSGINIKYIKWGNELKSLSALLMRGLCDMKQKDICIELGNITQSHASKLCLKGLKLINEKDEYKDIITVFISSRCL